MTVDTPGGRRQQRRAAAASGTPWAAQTACMARARARSSGHGLTGTLHNTQWVGTSASSSPSLPWPDGCQRADLIKSRRPPASARYQGPDLQVRAEPISALAPTTWTGEVATFCDKQSSDANNYKVTIIWDAAGWAGAGGDTDATQPLQSIQARDGLIASSPGDVTVTPAGKATDGYGYFRVTATHTYRYPSIRTVTDRNGNTITTRPRDVGFYGVIVVVQKTGSPPNGGAVATDETNAHIDSGVDVNDQTLGRQLGDQMVKDAGQMEVAFGDQGAEQRLNKLIDQALTAHPYDPWYAVGVLNDLADALVEGSDQPHTLAGAYDGLHSHGTVPGPISQFASAQHDSTKVARFFMSALTSGQADTQLCDTIIADMLLDGQKEPGWAALANAIAHNAAAADALSIAHSYEGFIRDTTSKTVVGVPIWPTPEYAQWQEPVRRFAATALADRVSTWANSHPILSAEAYVAGNPFSLAFGGPNGQPYASSLSTVEKGLGEYEAALMPHPLIVSSQFCTKPNQQCATAPDEQAAKAWAQDIGRGEGVIANAILGNAADQLAPLDPTTVSVLVGVGFWAALLLADPVIVGAAEFAALSADQARSSVGLGAAILQPFAQNLLPNQTPPGADSSQVLHDQRLAADKLLAFLLLQRRALLLCNPGGSACNTSPVRLTQDDHVNQTNLSRIFADGDPCIVGRYSAQPLYWLADQNGLKAGLNAQDTLFAFMTINLFKGNRLTC